MEFAGAPAATYARFDAPDDRRADALLAELAPRGGLAFDAYSRASLLRRIRARMDRIGVGGFDDYRARLAADPAEHGHLVAAVPVHRTQFFRDPACWRYLAAEVLPTVLARRRPDAHLRAWSAGCATGEEAYTLAMLLAEAAGPDALAAGRVTVFATDVSERVVERGRTGRYRAEWLAGVPADYRDRYFRADGDHLVVRPALRRAVVFARHDLLRDPPLGRLDLVVCRNTLIYFTPAAQTGVLAGLYLALAPDGVLFTGRSESVTVWTDLFRALCHRHHVYAPCRTDRRGEALAMFPGRGPSVG